MRISYLFLMRLGLFHQKRVQSVDLILEAFFNPQDFVFMGCFLRQKLLFRLTFRRNQTLVFQKHLFELFLTFPIELRILRNKRVFLILECLAFLLHFLQLKTHFSWKMHTLLWKYEISSSCRDFSSVIVKSLSFCACKNSYFVLVWCIKKSKYPYENL